MADLSTYSDADIARMAGIAPPTEVQTAQTDPLDAATYMPGLFKQESGNNQSRIGDGGAAVGAGQLHGAAAIDAGISPDQRYDEAANRAASQKYLQQQLDKYKDQLGTWQRR